MDFKDFDFKVGSDFPRIVFLGKVTDINLKLDANRREFLAKKEMNLGDINEASQENIELQQALQPFCDYVWDSSDEEVTEDIRNYLRQVRRDIQLFQKTLEDLRNKYNPFNEEEES